MPDFVRALEFQSALQSIKDDGLYRYLRELDSPQGATIKIGHRLLLNFCSNDYLGLANDERLKAAMHLAIDRYGIGSGASPLICGRSVVHRRLEHQLAAYTGRDRALVFPSGYMANLAVLTTLGPGRKGHIFEDRLNHASLVDGALLSRNRPTRYRHRDIRSLRQELNRRQGRKMVITDAVFSMDGDIAPLNDIVEVCEEQNTLLAVDDAHGFGVLGKNGRGTLSLFGLDQAQVPVLVLTFGKAVGVAGACVAGPAEIIEMLIQKARPYIYSTAMPPVLAATISASLEILEQDDAGREHLKNLIHLFRCKARELSLPLVDSETPIQPLIIGSNEDAVSVSNMLFQHGILVAAIRPPTVPVNSARLRITLTAAHSEAQVQTLLDALSRCMSKAL